MIQEYLSRTSNIIVVLGFGTRPRAINVLLLSTLPFKYKEKLARK